MAQIIQIKRTAQPVSAANKLAPATGLVDSSNAPAADIQAGELFYATASVEGTGSGVLYIGDANDSTAASIIGGKAFTSMLHPHQSDDETKITQSLAAVGGAASITLADDTATGSIKLSSPATVAALDTEILLPAATGNVTAGSLLSVNSSSKLAANLQTTGKFIADSGLDATNSGIVNTGAIANATEAKATPKTTITVEIGDDWIGESTADAEGNTPPDASGLWVADDTVVTVSPKLDVNLGYHGQLDAGSIKINETPGKIEGSTLSGGSIVASESITTNEFTAASGAYSVDASGNVDTTGEIRSLRTDNATNMVIDDGSISNAKDIAATGTVSVTESTGIITDGTASLQAGQLTGSTGVTLASGNVTAPVVKTTGTAQLDGNAISGGSLDLTGSASIKGSLEVTGGLLQTSTSDVTISDSMVQVAADGFGQTVTNDLGWFGNTSRVLVAPSSVDGTLVSQNDGPASPVGTDGIAGTAILGTDRVIRVLLSTDGNTYGFDHDTVIGQTHVDGGGNAAPTGTWAVGDAFQVGPTNYPTTANTNGNGVGKWGDGDLYLTYAGMAYDQQTKTFKLLQNDAKPGTNWDTGTSNKATLVADLTGDVTGDLTGNADTVTTNANLTGGVTSIGNATTVVTNANLTGDVTSTGNATQIAIDAVHATMINPDVAGTNLLVDESTGALNVDLTSTAVGSINAQISSKIDTEATSSLAGGTDVTISDAANDEVLQYVVDEWKNQTLTEAGIQATLSAATTGGYGYMTADQVTKLEGIATGAAVNVIPDFAEAVSSEPDFIKNKPVNAVAGEGGNGGLVTKAQVDAIAVNDAKVSFPGIGTSGTTAMAGNTPIAYASAIPAMDADTGGLMSDAHAVKFEGIAAGAEVNVQSDWNQGTTSEDDFIKNKPSIAYASAIPAITATVGGLMDNDDAVKFNGIAAGANVNVKADFNATSGDAQILNQPSIAYATAIPAMDADTGGLMSDAHAVKFDGIAAGAEVNVQSSWTAASGDAFIANKPPVTVSGANDVVITPVGDDVVITLANGKSLTFNGTGITAVGASMELSGFTSDGGVLTNGG